MACYKVRVCSVVLQAPVSILDDGIQVGSLERIASREHEERHAHGGYLVDKIESLGAGELQRMALRLSAGSAMYAAQVAGLGHLPDNQQGTVLKITGLEGRPRCLFGTTLRGAMVRDTTAVREP